MSKNKGALGIAALLLIFTASDNAPGRPVRDVAPRPLLRPARPDVLLNDLHRMAELIGRMDRWGQMALHPPELPKLPPADDGFSQGFRGGMPL